MGGSERLAPRFDDQIFDVSVPHLAGEFVVGVIRRDSGGDEVGPTRNRRGTCVAFSRRDGGGGECGLTETSATTE